MTRSRPSFAHINVYHGQTANVWNETLRSLSLIENLGGKQKSRTKKQMSRVRQSLETENRKTAETRRNAVLGWTRKAGTGAFGCTGITSRYMKRGRRSEQLRRQKCKSDVVIDGPLANHKQYCLHAKSKQPKENIEFFRFPAQKLRNLF